MWKRTSFSSSSDDLNTNALSPAAKRAPPLHRHNLDCVTPFALIAPLVPLRWTQRHSELIPTHIHLLTLQRQFRHQRDTKWGPSTPFNPLSVWPACQQNESSVWTVRGQHRMGLTYCGGHVIRLQLALLSIYRRLWLVEKCQMGALVCVHVLWGVGIGQFTIGAVLFLETYIPGIYCLPVRVLLGDSD